MKKTFLKYFLILALSLSSYNSSKAIWGSFLAAWSPIIVPAVVLGVYALYKKLVCRRLANAKKIKRLQVKIVSVDKNIGTFRTETNENFDQTKQGIQKSKNDLFEKIELARKKLKSFVNKRVTKAEDVLSSNIGIVKTDLMARFNDIEQQVNKCSTNEQVAKLQAVVEDRSQHMERLFNKQIADIKNQIENHDKKSEDRFKQLHKQNFDIESKVSDMNNKLCQMNEMNRNFEAVKTKVSQVHAIVSEMTGFNRKTEQGEVATEVRC